LPTEAEWEYACRATTTTKYAFGEILTPQQANFGRKMDLAALRRGDGEIDGAPGGPAGTGGDVARPPLPPGGDRGRRGRGEPPRERRTAPQQRDLAQREPVQRPLEPAGSFPANEWGLHDMHGSVWEWCGDFYSAKTYKTGSRVDPIGPESGKTHVARGGCWSSPAPQCASAYRNAQPQANARMPAFGFRVVCEIRAPAGN
jgi:formylglycine-generating enzyme required for sulfatase activity